MKGHVREAYRKYGFPLPAEHHFTILCRWKPPKELWPTLGKRWRDIAVEVLGANKPDVLADEVCLFLIATYCGTALAHHVIGPDKELIPVRFPTEYDRTWFRDVVTFGVDVVHCPDLWAAAHNEDTDKCLPQRPHE